jgi:hypothetical protein
MERQQNPTVTLSGEVNPNDVWGSKQQIIEIIGYGSKLEYDIKNANLPPNWEKSNRIKEISPDAFADFTNEICEHKSFKLENVSFDKNKMLTNLAIKDIKNGDVSELYLSDRIANQEEQKGIYVSKNVNKIGAAVIIHTMMSKYLDYGWGSKFDYGYVESQEAGFTPINLHISKSILYSNKEITGESYQRRFRDEAFNIAGRFGCDLQDIIFDERGILKKVCGHGNETNYELITGRDKSSFNNEYHAHNVDDIYTAVAFHGIVASHLNYINNSSNKDK